MAKEIIVALKANVFTSFAVYKAKTEEDVQMRLETLFVHMGTM